METDNFQTLQTIIQGKSLSQQISKTSLHLAVEAIVKNIPSSLEDSINSFTHYLNDQRNIFIHADSILSNIPEIKFIIAKNNKMYNFDKDSKGYVLCGKAASVYKRSKSSIQQTNDDKNTREQFTNLIEHGIARLFYDGKYILNKWEKNYNLEDILLQNQMPDANVQEVLLLNTVYSPFVPIQKSIVMIVPSKPLKYECTQFLRSSLLHMYIDQAALINRIITKQIFYKNSILRGIYFIEEGEVEVVSGRIIARGWTTHGKCKTSGTGWKFKPVPFIRCLGKYKVWKQFFNDLKLNEEYPFNIINILGIREDDDFTQSAEWKSLGKKKLGAKSTRLPRLINRSVDEEKYHQLQKMRHYDERIDGLFSYKQDLLTRKLKGNLSRNFQPIYSINKQAEKSIQKKKVLSKINSKKSYMSRQTINQQEQSENILILSVLKRLQSFADTELQKNQRLNPRQKRSNIKITPMQIYQKNKKTKKQLRYPF